MEPDTLERVAAEHGDSIYRVALQYTRHTADAEDVLQEVLLERFRTRQAFLSPEHERRWLLKVAVNKCRNLHRSRRRRPDLPLDDALELSAPPEPDYRPLYDAVNSLPPSTGWLWTCFILRAAPPPGSRKLPGYGRPRSVPGCAGRG